MTERTIWRGELVRHSRLLFRGSLFLSSGLLWLTIFLLIPTVLLTVLAFATRGSYGEILFWERADDGHVIWRLTFEQFHKLAGYGIMGWSADYLRIAGRTLWLALATTAVTLLLAYPLAFFIAAHERRGRYFWMLAMMVPFCTNLVIRLYAWQLLLAPGLPPAQVAQWLGLIGQGDGLYPSTLAVYLGMITNNLPFAVLPLLTTVERMDWSIVEAAQDLYSSRLRVLQHGILPQTRAGLKIAFILTFIPALGMFLVPDLLGGAKFMLLGNLMQQQFGAARNFPFGAAVSFSLIVVTLIALQLLRRTPREQTR